MVTASNPRGAAWLELHTEKTIVSPGAYYDFTSKTIRRIPAEAIVQGRSLAVETLGPNGPYAKLSDDPTEEAQALVASCARMNLPLRQVQLSF